MDDYALYFGDRLIMIASLSEIAETLGVKEKTARYYATEGYKKRDKGRAIAVVYLGDDDD